VQGNWTKEDAAILTKRAWKICDDVVNRSGVDLPILIKHWPRHLFEAGQRWTASLNN
jgi:hypothetical protein